MAKGIYRVDLVAPRQALEGLKNQGIPHRQLLALQARHIPAYVEKPVCTIAQWLDSPNRGQLEYIERQPWKCAVGFQYRYHPATERMHKSDRLVFTAQDDLIRKYGATVSETMAVHSLDLAIFMQGAPRYAELHSNGVTFTGSVYHRSGAVSEYNLRIDRGPRQSSIAVTYERGGQVNLLIERDDQMYVHALAEWLHWIRDRVPPNRLAKLSDGLRVMKLIGEATL